MREGSVHVPPPVTVDDLAHALSDKVSACQILTQNWRNRVYRVGLANGRTVIAKQLLVGTDATFHYQCDQHERLMKLQIPKLRIPKVLGLLPGKHCYVMEFVRGETIQSLIWKRHVTDALVCGCELAGQVLARMHLLHTKGCCRTPTREIARDFSAAAWHLRSQEREILQAALERLALTEFSVGEIFYDYKPPNLLFEPDALYLIDPPDAPRLSVHLWDFSFFRSSMRRHLWAFGLRHPFDRRREIIRQSMRAFERAYISEFAGALSPLFPLATRLFELQRTAQRFTMQHGKIKLAKSVVRRREYLLPHPLAHRLSLPLLNIEKRWLFAQLARALASGEA